MDSSFAQTCPIFSGPFTYYIHVICFEFVQDAVDILDSLLDQRNDISFQEISTQVIHTIYIVGCCIFMYVDIFNDYICMSTDFLAVQ